MYRICGSGPQGKFGTGRLRRTGQTSDLRPHEKPDRHLCIIDRNASDHDFSNSCKVRGYFFSKSPHHANEGAFITGHAVHHNKFNTSISVRRNLRRYALG